MGVPLFKYAISEVYAAGAPIYACSGFGGATIVAMSATLNSSPDGAIATFSIVNPVDFPTGITQLLEGIAAQLHSIPFDATVDNINSGIVLMVTDQRYIDAVLTLDLTMNLDPLGDCIIHAGWPHSPDGLSGTNSDTEPFEVVYSCCDRYMPPPSRIRLPGR